MTFTDDGYGGDGTVYDVLTVDLLSEVDLAAMIKLQRRAALAFSGDRSGEALQAFNELIALLIPTLPKERIAAIPLTFKTRFVDFWHSSQPQLDPKAMGVRSKAATPTPDAPPRSSPDSPPPTA